nr:hypothetical protein CFP56_48322 [Quercus suber]
MWTKALNLVGVRASSNLRKMENIFYPLVLQIAAPPTSQTTTAPKIPTIVQLAGKASTTASTIAKTSVTTQLTSMGATKATSTPIHASKEKEGKEAEHSEPPSTDKAEHSEPPSTGV